MFIDKKPSEFFLWTKMPRTIDFVHKSRRLPRPAITRNPPDKRSLIRSPENRLFRLRNQGLRVFENITNWTMRYRQIRNKTIQAHGIRPNHKS